MEICTFDPCNTVDWQTVPVKTAFFLRHKLEAVENGSLTIEHQLQKPLTKEALYMIYVILTFVGLSVIGTLITLYDYFQNGHKKTNCPSDAAYKKQDIANGTNTEYVQKPCATTSDSSWLNAFKSFLNCFCIITNGKKILSLPSNDDPLSCLYGIRLFCTLGIMGGHCIALYTFALKSVDHLSFFNEWYGQFVINSHCIITGLFVLGGFLNAYTFFVFYEKTKGNIPYLLFYLNRFRRITPVHLLHLGFFTTLFTYTGSGPLWPRFTTNALCRDTWWRDVLYISNCWSIYEQCIPWTWHIMVDMQLYLISPLFLVPLIKWRKYGYFLTGITICGGSYLSYILTLKYNLSSGVSRFESAQKEFYIVIKGALQYVDELYTRPYTRISSYLIGFLLALVVYEKRTNKAAKESTVTLFCGWIISIVLMGVFVFALYGRDVSTWDIAVYNGVKELFFSCGFAWMVYVCVTGQAGFLNRFLSWKYFVPLSRLCYCAGLFHLTLLHRYYYQAVKLEIPAVMPQIHLLIYISSLTFLISFLVSLICEIPLSRLFTLFVERKSNLKKEA